MLTLRQLRLQDPLPCPARDGSRLAGCRCQASLCDRGYTQCASNANKQLGGEYSEGDG
jgi:hypothetical protein